MKKIPLVGEWKFRRADEQVWKKAVVPGNQYSDLLRLGEIPEPYIGTNEQKVLWVGREDWVYNRELELPKNALGGKVFAVFECLDTLATVSINGVEIGKTDNINRRYEFDVTEIVKQGNNDISVYFRSPVKYIEQKRAKDKKPSNSNGIKGSPHIRKTQCHFGWDWGPTLPTVGIAGDAYLLCVDKFRISDLHIRQKHENGIVELSVSAEISAFSAGECRVRLSITNPDGKTEKREYDLDKESLCVSDKFIISDPTLWWTNDLSETEFQPLYTVRAEIINEHDCAVEKRVGLRTITLERTLDKYGRQFRFLVNAVPVFCKGANWIPADALNDRVTPQTLDYYFKAMRDANFNMVRVWGGGYYESEGFYDRCDENGILVWQDFGFACGLYPFYDDDLLATVKKEVEDNVKRLRHRASLALWCGNNEIEMDASRSWWKRKLIRWIKKFFHILLPEWLKPLDDVTPYITGSPCASEFMKNVNSHNDGDAHLWNVWHGLQPLTYYRKRFSRFCSEFGMESLPDIETIAYFAKPEDYDMRSEVFMAHQKCLSGNNKILYYISTRFRLPEKFEDMAYFSQIVQSECIKDATEHWRRNTGRCNGAIYWQLNDCWPVLSWAGIDYFGRYKALHYNAKRFNAPVLLSAYLDGNSVKLCLVNDKLREFNGTVSCVLGDFEGKRLFEESFAVKGGALSAEHLKSYDFSREVNSARGNLVFCTRLLENGAEISNEKLLFKPEKQLKFPEPGLTAVCKRRGDYLDVSVGAKAYSRYVKVALANSNMPFDANYFDLLAGESKTVSIYIGQDKRTEAELARDVSIRAANVISPKQSRFGDFLLRTRVLLIPKNLWFWIAYHFR